MSTNLKLLSLVPPSYSLANPLDIIKSFMLISFDSISKVYILTNSLPHLSF